MPSHCREPSLLVESVTAVIEDPSSGLQIDHALVKTMPGVVDPLCTVVLKW